MRWLRHIAVAIALAAVVGPSPIAGQRASVAQGLVLTDPRDLTAQGRIFIEQGELAEAERQFLLALEAWQKARPLQPFGQALTHGLLADVYRRLGDVERASKQYGIADDMLEKLGPRLNSKQRAIVFQHRGRLANDLGLTHQTAGDYAKAEAIYRRSLELKSQGLPVDHIQFAVTYFNLADSLVELKRDSEAQTLLQRSIKIREPVLGPDHEDVGRAYGFLAGIAVRAERSEEAIDHFKRAVRALQHNADFWHPTLAVYLSDLSELLNGEKRYAEAEYWTRQEVAVRQQYLAGNSADLAFALLRQGNLMLEQGKAAAAIPVLEKALALGDPHALPDGFDPAEYLYSLAAAHEQLQQYEHSIAYIRETIALAEQLYGRNDPRVILYLEAYSGLLGRAGLYKELPDVLQRIVELVELEKGPDHPDLIDPLLGVQNATAALGRYEESAAAIKRAIEIARMRGTDTETLAILFNNLGLLYVKLGRIGDAEPYHQEALALSREAHGADSLQYASNLANVAQVYAAHGQHDEAISLGEAALAIREAHPAEPESIAISLNNLANAYRLSGHPTDPEPMYHRAISLIAESLGPNHPDIASPMNNLAGHYRKNSRFEEAEVLYLKVLAIRETSFGKAHEKYANALDKLGVLYRKTERNDLAEETFRNAIAAYQEAGAITNLEAVWPLSSLSEMLVDSGRLAEAFPFVDMAAQIQAMNLGTDSRDYRQSQSTMAWIYAAYGQYDEALGLYRSLLVFLIRKDGIGGEQTKAALAQIFLWEQARDHPP